MRSCCCGGRTSRPPSSSARVMWRNIAVQSSYQVTVLLLLLYGDTLTSFSSGWSEVERNTVIFNSFVWLQLFLRAQQPQGQRRVESVPRASSTTGCSQPSSQAASRCRSSWWRAWASSPALTPLSASQWALCVAIGALSLPVGFLQRLIPVDHRHGEIELDASTFEGAHLDDDGYDAQRRSSRELLPAVNGKKKDSEQSNGEARGRARSERGSQGGGDWEDVKGRRAAGGTALLL